MQIITYQSTDYVTTADAARILLERAGGRLTLRRQAGAERNVRNWIASGRLASAKIAGQSWVSVASLATFERPKRGAPKKLKIATA